MDDFLLDKNFLAQLDQQRMKKTYAKIILLTWEEEPVCEIQGKITKGSINIDGTSAVRRTCSLTMVSPDVDMSNTYWALKNKFKLEIGVENNINSCYPNICWFKQGIFCFASLSMKNETSNFTIDIQGQDKMCLLNGTLGGGITAETDFGQLEEQTILNNGEYLYDLTDIPIKTIIKNAVHFFAGQPLKDIIINDVDDYGLELLEYRAENSTLYMLRSVATGEIENVTTKGSTKYYIKNEKTNKPKSIALKEIENPYLQMGDFDYNNSGDEDNLYQATIIYSTEEKCKDEDISDQKQVIKIEQYDTAGYRLTDLTYAGELVAKVGENLTTILDKIKEMFSCFEYFFDVDGRFVFQKKRTYQADTWTPLTADGSTTYALDAAYTSSSVYQFENNRIIISCSNNPDILNLKNDYSIWGARTSVTGDSIPIHLRYAIEFKPNYYVSERREKQMDDSYEWKRRLFIVNDYEIDTKEKEKIPNFSSLKKYIVDWREIIYQMALDYYSLNEWLEDNTYDPSDDYIPTGDDVLSYSELLILNNPSTCEKGKTGYENFYTDQQGFWRQLYMPALLDGYSDLFSISEKRAAARWYWYEQRETTEPTKKDINNIIKNKKRYWRKYFTQDFNEETGYSQKYEKEPETLNYYFDFMDAKSDFGQYAISSIGDRVKAINDDKITSIYFKETPTVIFISRGEKSELSDGSKEYSQSQGYTLVNLTSQLENYFTISAQGKSAWDELQTQMYQYTNFAENITLTTVPIYYLEPNNRILIKNDNADINGEYIITKITIPLEYNSTTSITATKAVERIF